MTRRPAPLPAALATQAQAQYGLLTRAQLLRGGVPVTTSARRVRSGHWGRPCPGVFDVDPEAPRTIREQQLRDAEISRLAAGRDAVLIGLAALAHHGNRALPTRFVARASRTPKAHLESGPGRRVSQHANFPVTSIQGRRLATVPWAILQALPEISQRRLVAVLDSALNLGHITSVDEVLSLSDRRRGARMLRAAVPYVDGRSESDLETQARLLCAEAGLPPDAVQLVIGTRLGEVRVDLGWQLRDSRWLLVEIDGESVHGAPSAVFADRRRQNLLARPDVAGLLRFTAADIHQPGYLVAQVRIALRELNAAWSRR